MHAHQVDGAAGLASPHWAKQPVPQRCECRLPVPGRLDDADDRMPEDGARLPGRDAAADQLGLVPQMALAIARVVASVSGRVAARAPPPGGYADAMGDDGPHGRAPRAGNPG